MAWHVKGSDKDVKDVFEVGALLRTNSAKIDGGPLEEEMLLRGLLEAVLD